ncbi:MAG TPA: hypothetical protein V6D47_18985 [Oscillatoriaceae cyanobacterium]
MAKRAPALLALLQTAALLAACTGAPGPTGVARHAITKANNFPAPAIPTGEPGGNIISNNGSSLTGVVTAPASLISNNGGSLIGNNGGSLIGNNGGSYHVLTALSEVPVAGIKVELLDAAGKPVTDASGTPIVALTDGKGQYHFAAALPAHGLVLRADLGTTGQLAAIAAHDHAAATPLDVDLISTLTTDYILDTYVKTQTVDPTTTLDKLPASVEAQTRAVTSASFASDTAAVPTALTASAADALVTTMRQQNKTLDSQLETVRKLLVVGGSASQTDGSAFAAQLNLPRGLARDAAGNLYIADAQNNLIRRLDSTGEITTIAGDGQGRNWDGAGVHASIYEPIGLAVSPDDKLYMVCQGAAIRKIDLSNPTFPVTTLVPGVPGRANGPAAQAHFRNPNGLALDTRDAAHPMLYVADTNNNLIRAIDLAGSDHQVTTLAGTGKVGAANGPAASATFSLPRRLALSADGKLYVADSGNGMIRCIDLTSADHTVTTIAGTGQIGFGDGPGTVAAFNNPGGLAFDGTSRLLIADTGNQAIRAIDLASPAHTVSTLTMSQTTGKADGPAAQASFNRPEDIVADGAGGFDVADAYNQLVRHLAGGVVSTIAGSGVGSSLDGTGTAALLNKPRGGAIDTDGTIYLADTFNHEIRAIAQDGTVTTLAGQAGGVVGGFADGPGAQSKFFNPYNLVIDRRDTAHPALLVADTYNNRIRRIDLTDPTYPVTTIAGTGTAGHNDGPGATALLNEPAGLALSADGKLYVGEIKNPDVRCVDLTDPSYPVTTIAGAGTLGHADGPGVTATFNGIYGLALSGEILYAADTYNERVRAIDLSNASHTVTTIAGGAQGTADGPGLQATFHLPEGLALGPDGQLFVADAQNSEIRVIDTTSASDTVSTYPATGLSLTAGVIVDGAGNVYAIDTNNNRVVSLGN